MAHHTKKILQNYTFQPNNDNMSFSLFIFTQCDTLAYLNAYKADILEVKQLIYRGLYIIIFLNFTTQ